MTAIQERLALATHTWGNKVSVVERDPSKTFTGSRTVGEIEVEVIDGNVVVTVRRIDEAACGPISVVVV